MKRRAIIAVLGALAFAPAAARAAIPTYRAHRAGYAVLTTGPSFAVTATFTVPAVMSSCNRFRAFAPTVEVFTSSQHTFANSTGPSLFVGCYQGRAQYFPEIVVNGQSTNYLNTQALPGDKVVLSVSEDATSTSESVVDQTHAFTVTGSGSGSSILTFPAVMDEDWGRAGRIQPVPNFGSLRFYHATINGQPLSSFGSLARYNMWTHGSSGGVMQIRAGALASTGMAFGTYFKSGITP